MNVLFREAVCERSRCEGEWKTCECSRLAARAERRASEVKVKVMAWLSNIFGDEQIPDFEINQQTIEFLHQLSQETLQHDQHLQLVTTDFKQKASEYNAEAKRLSGILHRLHLPPESLTKAGASSLTALSKLGILLDVKDSSNTR
ncbi:HAUS augmin-like complex subunit 1 [Elysia marginata]|uniref:HAUS augmin-like complex subunit 1 n=1 Tax=Elysia marginata TaxID=1093978 RepID=A0AAV4I9G9_9GAST|nr:HAUS augmin-like complex subunit 1 [Elysia marginata]